MSGRRGILWFITDPNQAEYKRNSSSLLNFVILAGMDTKEIRQLVRTLGVCPVPDSASSSLHPHIAALLCSAISGH